MNTIIRTALACLLLVSCVKTEIGQQELASTTLQTKGIGDIFTVTEIDQNGYGLTNLDDFRAVDLYGNLYFCVQHISPSRDFLKYDLSADSIMYIAPRFGAFESNFCFDNNNNICYLNDSLGNFSLIRMTPNGSSIMTQQLSTPFVIYSLYGNLVATNAAAQCYFFFCGSFDNGLGLLRMSPAGMVTKVIDNLTTTSLDLVHSFMLFKANGENIWGVDGDGHVARMTNSGTVDETSLRFPIVFTKSVTATTGASQINLYALNGYQIVKVRHNQLTDLVIGTIPSIFKNANGIYEVMDQPHELHMNADGSIFYIIADNRLFKLTLP